MGCATSRPKSSSQTKERSEVNVNSRTLQLAKREVRQSQFILARSESTTNFGLRMAQKQANATAVVGSPVLQPQQQGGVSDGAICVGSMCRPRIYEDRPERSHDEI